MKMDHHCPWINNCVGFKNHTNFLLFLYFVPIGCMHSLIVYTVTLYNNLYKRPYFLYAGRGIRVSFSTNAFIMNVIAYGLAIGTTIAVGILFFQQLKVVITNKTGIEQWIVEKAKDRKRSKDEALEFIYPYDYGWKENLKQVVNLSCTPIGDGLSWKVVKGCHDCSLSIEQLKQKEDKRRHIVLYLANDNYSGRLFPCSKGFKTCISPPCTDDPRAVLEPGMNILVNRATKNWLYGEIIPDTTIEFAKGDNQKNIKKKGWFPRNCATRIGNYSLLQQQKTDCKKDN